MSNQSESRISIWNQSVPQFDHRNALKTYSWLELVQMRFVKNQIPTIVPYLIDSGAPSPVVIVCPGGGYLALAPHEGKPIAEWLNSLGISAFVLNYRHRPFRHPIPFLDAQRAVRYVRYHANRFNIDPKKIGMLGFSAGGHLTSTAGTLAQNNWFPPNYIPDDVDTMSPFLNFMILCYPVIDFRFHPHKGSVRNLLGRRSDPALYQLLSTHEQVSSTTPPTFLWTTREDNAVPYSHTEGFGTALSNHRIPYEMHIFNSGHHGLGLAKDHPEVRQWTELCARWLGNLLNNSEKK